MNDKISAKHLERAAYVYIRQSTLQQVRQNLESSRRQYALQDRARELGFQEVVVIDEDLGVSGAGHHERFGFGRLLAAVCDGRVGAVLAMEASRLARNNRDWHHLVKFQQRYVKSHRKVPPTPSHLPCDLSWLSSLR
jgi:DNA invertase Pin-like site-specific DNA recombinase